MDGVVIMTALPPTRGHQSLIDFAIHFMENEPLCFGGDLYVLVFGNDEVEPVPPSVRAAWITDHYGQESTDSVHIRVMGIHTEAPDRPDGPNFWKTWRDEVMRAVYPGSKKSNLGYFFASEPYGAHMADVLGCEFIPWDVARKVVPTVATDFRRDPMTHFGHLMDEAAKALRQTVCLFGAESTGTTTTARGLAEVTGSTWVPEWARTYMEEADRPDVTDELMRTVLIGQSAAEETARRSAHGPFLIKDTDLLSTLGYYRIYGGQVDDDAFRSLYRPADLYLVMSSDVPFVPDPLRFGGDRRESTDRFWTDLLDEFGLKYRVVDSREGEYDRKMQAFEFAKEHLLESSRLYSYERT
jgi:NadR type nicotinamide-nucleotide adenylyltransferase